MDAPLSVGALEISAPGELYIPRQLQANGLAGYEPETLACFLTCLEHAPAGPFYDIGANVGVFSWLAAVASDRRVVAFEPTPATAQVCRAIGSGNDLNIEVESIALADEEGMATLYLSVQSDCSNSLDAEFRRATGTIEVPVSTVDAYRARRGDSPALLKIDTEQTEPAVIRGARELLSARNTWMICEVLRGQEPELTELLEPLGYHWYQITNEPELVARREIFADRSNTFRNWLLVPEALDDVFFARMVKWHGAIRRCEARTVRRAVEAPAISFGPDNDSTQFHRRWRPTDGPRFKARRVGDSVELSSTLLDDQSLYFFHGKKGFNDAESAEESVAVASMRQYEVALDVAAVESEMPRVTLWILLYDAATKLDSKRLSLRPGKNSLAFDTLPNSVSVRVAFRIAGPGTLTLGPMSFHEVGHADA